MSAAAASSHEAVPHRGLITLSIMLATIMQVLDTTIANVALPAMTGDLGASPDTINWVLTSYIVAAAIMTPMTGWLSDRFGRREFFLASVVGFTVFSMLCGLSWSLESMVMFRLFQGIFGAAIVPLSQTFLLDINPKENHGSAMAMWGAGIMVGPIIGPTLGGWLTETMNWRWVFFINLPVGILSFLGCAAYLPNIARRLRGFDFFGFAMLSLGVGALQLMLDRGAEVDWFSAAEIWIELGLCLIGFWVFTIHLMTGKDTFIDAHIFRDRNFVTGLVFIFIVGIILLASLALLPPMLSRLFGHSTILTGLVMAPRGVGSLVSMILVGRLVRFIDARVLVVVGLSLTAWSLHIMTGFTPQMDDHLIILSGVVQGLGLGLVFVPLSTVAFATLDPKYRTDGTSLFSLTRNIGSSIGISVVTVLLTRNTQINHAELSTHINPFNPALQAIPGAAQGNPTGLSIAEQLVNQQALMISYIDDFKLMMIVTLAAMPLVLLLRMPKRAPAGDAVAAAME
ncbi:DHA2 family efflux MFS transporter permease subunit [Nitratireductor indicus]|uniref:EmrB/QacA family drug resistance transporter n=1 Tax=Nitratireductor indicus C115 TaxID=1231190 RepID=K2NY40_9HYPH|nr:DHA2 family efflux MFS transporter permease subunit [Nitratireductor indicus]EKF44105.1 EmrB/QacA family drug resistance transporter [Nitratireductor indicus C115]MDS1137063.1 DHA2 family efflux MFS transporter permease subunit [Nitratireductor indicus]SFQ23403.1 MFS transporter, DHA2 family, multidrug resistance protein [Nitratireductor indicus]